MHYFGSPLSKHRNVFREKNQHFYFLFPMSAEGGGAHFIFRGNAEEIAVPFMYVKPPTEGGITYTYDDIITFVIMSML